MTRRYTGQQSCPIARSLDLLGDRWMLLVVRDLHRGYSKFAELLAQLRGISPAVLSDRLKALEAAGIVERSFYSQHPPRAEYVLTAKGRALQPVLQAFSTWGTSHAPRPPRSPRSAAISTAERTIAPEPRHTYPESVTGRDFITKTPKTS